MFENPAALWGLVGLVVPILVHLLNFRPPRLVLFSQLGFLKAISEVVVQRMRLKRLLLLALRLLAIAATVLAFAGPRWGTSGNSATPRGGVHVVVIDNSRSMMDASRQGSLLDQAKEAATVLLRAKSPTDDVLLLPLSGLDERQSTQPASAALEQLPRIDFGETSPSLREIVAYLTDYLATDSRTAADVWIFSDFQQSTLLADSLPPLPTDSSLRFHLLPLGAGAQPAPNYFATNLRLTAPLLDQQTPAALSFTLHNTGTQPARAVDLRVALAGQTVASTSVDLPAQDSSTHTLSFRLPATGWLPGTLTLADPHTGFDNTRAFALHLPTQSRLLHVTGPTPSRYLSALLAQVGGRFSTTTVPQDRLTGTELSTYDVILLAGVTTLAGSLQERLARWVEEGGGLVVFAADDLDLAAFNRLYGRMTIGQWGEAERYDPLLPITLADAQHPLFRGVFDLADTRASFDPPRASRLQRFQPLPGRVQATILQTESRTPVLHEARVGRGAVYTHTWFPDLTWGDFPVKSAFVPIVYRSLLLAAGAYEPPLAYSLSSQTRITLETDQASLVRLQRSDGLEVVPDQSAFPGGVTLRTRRSGLQPGAYRALQDDSLRQWVAFQTPAAESFPQRPSATELRQWLMLQPTAAAYTVFEAPPAQLESFLARAETTTQWWRWLVALALICLLAEVAVVRLVK